VAPSAPGAPGDEQLLARHGQVAERLPAPALRHHGAEGYAEHGVGAAPPMLVGALAVLAALRGVMALVVIVEESGDGGVGFQDHAAAVASVTAVGAPTGDELLPAEAHASGASVTALDEDVDLVNE